MTVPTTCPEVAKHYDTNENAKHVNKCIAAYCESVHSETKKQEFGSKLFNTAFWSVFSATKLLQFTVMAPLELHDILPANLRDRYKKLRENGWYAIVDMFEAIPFSQPPSPSLGEVEQDIRNLLPGKEVQRLCETIPGYKDVLDLMKKNDKVLSEVVEEVNTKHCVMCKRRASFRRCKCHTVYYCSEKCNVDNWERHQDQHNAAIKSAVVEETTK